MISKLNFFFEKGKLAMRSRRFFGSKLPQDFHQFESIQP